MTPQRQWMWFGLACLVGTLAAASAGYVFATLLAGCTLEQPHYRAPSTAYVVRGAEAGWRAAPRVEVDE